jgi:glutamyl-tRNA(Gln) amidotransferase subunit D
MNLIGATDLVGRVDAAEVMVVMHGQSDDKYVYAHRGTRVRKSHTSRRDAFKSVNYQPLFRVEGSEIVELTEPLLRRDSERKLKLKPKFEENVALVKTYPGIYGEYIETMVERGIKGIVLEGTGLGHTPEHTHPYIKKAIDSGAIVAMTSQCISGRVDMNVYRPGVELLQMGVISCENMLAETAVAKMMWLLANTKSVDAAAELMNKSLVGELDPRTEQREYESQQE